MVPCCMELERFSAKFISAGSDDEMKLLDIVNSIANLTISYARTDAPHCTFRAHLYLLMGSDFVHFVWKNSSVAA
jgi:hypothetical protein